jgi:hypothetical protein
MLDLPTFQIPLHQRNWGCWVDRIKSARSDLECKLLSYWQSSRRDKHCNPRGASCAKFLFRRPTIASFPDGWREANRHNADLIFFVFCSCENQKKIAAKMLIAGKKNSRILKNKDAEIIILSIPKNFHYYNHG